MSLSAYDISIPVIIRGLSILDEYVGHAEALAAAKGLTAAEVLSARLAPDMLTFAEQITVMSNKAERYAAKLIEQDPPAPRDAEVTYAGLKARLAQAITVLERIPVEAVEGAESRIFELSDPLVRGWFAGADYILQLILPDLFFHVTTAHDILRHLGAPVGKRSYLGRFGLEQGGYT